jgi:hypothetical protein
MQCFTLLLADRFQNRLISNNTEIREWIKIKWKLAHNHTALSFHTTYRGNPQSTSVAIYWNERTLWCCNAKCTSINTSTPQASNKELQPTYLKTIYVHTSSRKDTRHKRLVMEQAKWKTETLYRRMATIYRPHAVTMISTVTVTTEWTVSLTMAFNLPVSILQL